MEEQVNRALKHFESTLIPSAGYIRDIEQAIPDIGLLPNTGGAGEILPRLHLAGTLKEGHTIAQVLSHFSDLPQGVAVTVRNWGGSQGPPSGYGPA